MKTWKKFLAEKGKNSNPAVDVEGAIIGTKNKEMLEFFTKRKSGAAKIASQAIGNGKGPAQLTAWHFEAKSQPYQEVLSGIESGKPQSWFESKRGMCMERVHNSLTNQHAFQATMGELEVWGESCIKLFGKK